MTITEIILNGVTYNLVGSGGSGLTDDVKEALLLLAEKVAYADNGGQSYYNALRDAMYTPVHATSITLSSSYLQIPTLNATQQLTATVLPADTTDSVTWTSSDTSIATVSNTGLVTAIAFGSAIITATAGNVSATCSVVISEASLVRINAVYTQSGTVYNTDTLNSLKSGLVVVATYSNSATATIPSSDYILSGTLTVGTSTITVAYGGEEDTFTVTVTEYQAPDTTAEIAENGTGKVWSKDAPDTVNKEGFGITKWYEYEFTQEILESSPYWDAVNEYMTTAGWAEIVVYTPDTKTYAAGYSWPASANYKHVTGKDGVYANQYSITRNQENRMTFKRQSKPSVQANGFSASIPLLDIDDCYAYWATTKNCIYPVGVAAGDIIFAGANTPYYGLNNISEAET